MPIQVLLTKRLYTSSKHLIINSIGVCGVGASMLSSLFYSFILQYVTGICVVIAGVYFTRASVSYYVTRSFGGKQYVLVALFGIFGRIVADLIVSVVDRENHEELNRNLFVPLTVVFMLCLVVFKWKDNLHDEIKRN